MTDDELLRWAAETVAGQPVEPYDLDVGIWMTADKKMAIIGDPLGWPGFGFAVAEIERRGWQWSAGAGEFLILPPDDGDSYLEWSVGVDDGNYALAAWRALYQAMEATK